MHTEAIDPSRLFEHPEAHYFHLSSMLGPGSSPEIGRLAVFMLLTSATLSRRKLPVYLIIDEFQRIATRNLDYMLQLARSMNVGVILANQSMEDLRQADLISVLEANCRYRQWFAVSGWDDQRRLSGASGETVDSLHSVSVQRMAHSKGVVSSVSDSSQQFVAPRLTQNDIKLVTDDDRRSIVHVTRGAGYCQYGGMPIVVESDFHITAEHYRQRRDAAWPADEPGSFVPQDHPVAPTRQAGKRGRRRQPEPVVTEETIGPTASAVAPAFASYLADHPIQIEEVDS